MQLVNIGNVSEHVAGQFVNAVLTGDSSKAKKELESFTQPDPVLRAYILLAARKEYSLLPDDLLLADAITELTKKVYSDRPMAFLKRCLPLFLNQSYTTQDVSGFSLARDEMPEAVVVSALEDALEDGRPDLAAKAARDIMMVMDSKKYFNEIVLEIALGWHSEKGRVLEIANAVSKSLELFQWKQSDDLIAALLKYLSSSYVQNQVNPIAPIGEDADYAHYFKLAAASSDPVDWQFMTHVRQVYRYAGIKYHTIRPMLNARLQQRFSQKTLISPPDYAVNKQLTSEHMLSSLAENDIRTFLDSIATLQDGGQSVNEVIGELMPQEFGKQDLVTLNALRRVASALKFPANMQVFKSYANYIHNK